MGRHLDQGRVPFSHITYFCPLIFLLVFIIYFSSFTTQEVLMFCKAWFTCDCFVRAPHQVGFPHGRDRKDAGSKRSCLTKCTSYKCFWLVEKCTLQGSCNISYGLKNRFGELPLWATKKARPGCTEQSLLSQLCVSLFLIQVLIKLKAA